VTRLPWRSSSLLDSVRDAVLELLSQPDTAIDAFLRDAYIPALGGVEWGLTGITMLAPGSARTATVEGPEPYDILDAFRFLPEARTVVVFAGAPAGRPASRYQVAGTTELASTFDAELVELRSKTPTQRAQMRQQGTLPDLSGLEPEAPESAVRVLAGSTNTVDWFIDFVGANPSAPTVPLVNSRAVRAGGHSIGDLWHDLAANP